MEPTPSFISQREQAGKRALIGNVGFALGIALAFLLLVILLWVVSIILSITFVSQKEQAQAEIAKQAVAWPATLEQSILAIPARVNRFGDLLNGHRYPSKTFRFLEENILKGITLTSVDIKTNPSSLMMELTAPDLNVVASQVVWLRSLSFITNFSISGIKRSDEGKVKCTITLELAPGFFSAS